MMVLFVGGVAAGETHEILHGRHVVMMSASRGETLYDLHQLCDGERHYEVAGPSGWTMTQIFAELLAGYAKGAKL